MASLHNVGRKRYKFHNLCIFHFASEIEEYHLLLAYAAIFSNSDHFYIQKYKSVQWQKP